MFRLIDNKNVLIAQGITLPVYGKQVNFLVRFLPGNLCGKISLKIVYARKKFVGV